MFDASVQDKEKEKNSIFKYHRLSDAQKNSLYITRPDLNLKADIMEQLLTDDIEVGSSSEYHDSESKIVYSEHRENRGGLNNDSDEDAHGDCQEGGKEGSDEGERSDYTSPLQQRQTDVSVSSSEGSMDDEMGQEKKKCCVS